MKWWCAALVSTSLLLSGCDRAVSQRSDRDVKVSFLPFDHDPYTPLDLDHMDPGSFAFTVGPSDAALAAALGLLSDVRSAGHFNRKDVRVRVIWPSGRIVAVDKHGCVSDGGDKGCMENTVLKRFQRALEEIPANPYLKMLRR